jgi:23S rRNA (guanosine2251-2'-O)-methyltransferase
MEKETRYESAVCGRNAVKELLSSGKDIEKIYIQKGEREGSITVLRARALERRIPIIELDRSKLESMFPATHHQGIVAIPSEQNYSTVDEIIEYAASLGEPPFVVILDGVEDPHNLGAIIRTAECSGAHGVIIPKRRSTGITSVVTKSSAGAVAYMRVARVTNLTSTIDELKKRGFWIYAADMGGDDYSATEFSGSVAIVLGSEGYGISRLVKENCDFTVSIPLYGKVNSLNVSCASAVILTEVARQRHKKS